MAVTQDNPQVAEDLSRLDPRTARPTLRTSGNRLLRATARALLWPFRRFFDPRFGGLAHRIDAKHEDLASRLDTGVTEIATLRAESRQRHAENIQLARALADLINEADRFRQAMRSGLVDDIDADVARILNHTVTHRGFPAQRNLWFNPPVSVCYREGDVVLGQVNERIVEIPFVFQALAQVDAGATILDVGAAESTLAVSLASLGYHVTALDIRPYPLAHPSLETVVSPIQDWSHDEAFDVVICVSTIEHVGLGAYGEPQGDEDSDRAAMQRMRELTKPGGLLILTVSLGEAGVDEVQRTYDHAGLQALLEGWELEELTVARQLDPQTWVVAAEEPPSTAEGARVALVTARRATS
jgi:2-polyprenyl-3-methyl-5-hydroxy-6-metoxy-1,4-benzoquinol methylase